MSAAERYTNHEFLEFFRSRLKDLGAESALKYRRVIADMDTFMATYQLSLCDMSDTMMADWTVDLLRRGLAKSTVVRYLNILSSLVKAAAKKGLTAATDAPRTLARILTESADDLPPLLDESGFASCLGAIKAILNRTDAHDTVDDLLLASLLNGAAPIEEMAYLKKDDLGKMNDASRPILMRNMSSNRSYIFDLKQSYATPRQVYSAVSHRLQTKFGRYSGTAGLEPDALIRSVWTACAIRNGATASEALGCVGSHAPYCLPAFCFSADTDADHRAMWIRAVNSALAQDMPRWYAMRLRRGVKFNELRAEIAERIRPVPEFFYPCETFTRQIGSRKVMEDHPFITRTAFFKSHPDKVMPMFGIIGDKAWCYRVHNDPASPYAVIPQSEMRRFQSAIGVFTPDMEVHPLGQLTPRPGESVVVIMAGYGNREGRIEDVIHRDGHSAIFRVLLSTDQGYEWRMEVDGRQIERILN